MAEIKIDHRFNIMSYEQFKIDNEKYKFNKICMTEIINADMMIATFGEEKYFNSSREILEMGNLGYIQMGLDKVIKVYINSYKHFMAVANDDISDEDFLNLMQESHKQYELITAKQTGLSGISRFVVAFGDDLVNRVKSAYYMNKYSQTNFIVASNEKEIMKNQTEKDLELFDLLNYALNNDKVIPFYQGIYDNRTNKITKYEALMRIYDENGKLYHPGLYLEGAKKLKLYIPLSKMLIEKVLKDFKDKKSEFSINLAYYDIHSLEQKNWIINELKKFPEPNRINIEFVETENYINNIELFSFLNEVRALGCKVSVDDFGVGYATYSSIITLKPNTIKIDGDIIKNLAHNNECKIILESICYMAKLIGANIVAEFVENEMIQKIIMDHKVEYTQGYLFAKPEKIENLNIK